MHTIVLSPLVEWISQHKPYCPSCLESIETHFGQDGTPPVEVVNDYGDVLPMPPVCPELTGTGLS